MKHPIHSLLPTIWTVALIVASGAIAYYFVMYLPGREKARVEESMRLTVYQECRSQEDSYNQKQLQYAKESADRMVDLMNTPLRPGITKEQAIEGLSAAASLEKDNNPYKGPFDFELCAKTEMEKLQNSR